MCAGSPIRRSSLGCSTVRVPNEQCTVTFEPDAMGKRSRDVSSQTVGHRRTDQAHRANPITDSVTMKLRLLSSAMKSTTSSRTASTRAVSTNHLGRLAPLRAGVTQPSPGTSRRGKRILLVDDDPTVRDSLNEVLVAEGYSVMQVENGQQALDLANQLPVDIVLLDLNMPVKNGWDTFEQLTREHPLIPVIIATARPNQLFTALSAGAGALLEKPMEIPTLLRTMATLLTETTEQRLARLAGKEAEFHYQPATAGQ